MVKSLTDLVFPHPPVNAGEARGYVNQVLMAIGKLQKTPGNELLLVGPGVPNPQPRKNSKPILATLEALTAK